MPGDFIMLGQVWVTKTNVKDGESKEVKFPRLAFGFDPLEGEFRDVVKVKKDGKTKLVNKNRKDPYLAAGMEFQQHAFMNAIIRPLQDKLPKKLGVTKAERKTGFKDMDSESVTPVRAVRFTAGLVEKIGSLTQLNIHKVKDKKTGKSSSEKFEVTHAKYGRDILVQYNAKAPAASKYTIQMGDHTPLTPEELEYLKWDLTGLAKAHWTNKFSYEEIVAEAIRDEIIDDPENPGKKKGKSGKKSKSDELDDLDDDSFELGGKKKSKGKKSKLKSKVKAGKKKSKPADDDDEDEAPKKKKLKSKVKGKGDKVKTKSKDKVKSGKKKKIELDDDEIPF